MKRNGKLPPVIVSPVFINGTAFLRAFGKMGAHTVAVSGDPRVSGFSSRWTRERVVLPNAGEAPGRMTQWLLDRSDLHGGIVIPTGDEVVVELDSHRNVLAPRYRLSLPPARACEIALDKWKLAQVCASHDIPAPRTVLLDERTSLDTAGGLGFPVVVKPCYGIDFQRAYGGKLLVVDSPERLAELAAGCRERSFAVILQELLPREGTVSAYSAYVDREGRPAADYSSRRIGLFPPRYGVGYFEVAERIDQILDSGRRLVDAVGYSGALINIDFKLDPRDGRYKLLDFNARSWRQVSLARSVGYNVFETLRRDLLGEPPLPPVRPRWGGKWLCVKDALLVTRGYPADHPPFSSYLGCLLSPMSWALFDPRDPRPALDDIAPLLARRFKWLSRNRAQGKIGGGEI